MVRDSSTLPALAPCPLHLDGLDVEVGGVEQVEGEGGLHIGDASCHGLGPGSALGQERRTFQTLPSRLLGSSDEILKGFDVELRHFGFFF